MSGAVAYFITFTTYGTWLHGRDPGSVDRNNNIYNTASLPPDPDTEQQNLQSLRQDPYSLDDPRRKVVLSTIQEVVAHRKWELLAVNVLTNHVHIVVTSNQKIEKVMADFKSWCSRRLREAFGESAGRDRWTQHGSTRYLWTQSACDDAVEYVLNDQGSHFAAFPLPAEPEA